MHRPMHHAHKRPIFKPHPMFFVFILVESLFWALAATCVMSALHRIASALQLKARVKVLNECGQAFTEEERERLVHKIKAHSLGCV
jgi:hypothetical protein